MDKEAGYYDIHTHILPEVDDGSTSLNMTINILRQEYEDGVRVIYATPHYRRGMFETSRDVIKERYEIVKAYADKIGIRLILGCEYHANMDMISMIEAENDYTMGNSRCVLIEFSSSHDYRFIKERSYALLSEGFRPIIAHAERYPALRKDIDAIDSLVKMGAYIQINAGSILGKSGFFTKQFCKEIMKCDLVHFIGSDVHDLKGRRPLMRDCAQYLEKKMGQDYLYQILVDNPYRIIEEGR